MKKFAVVTGAGSGIGLSSSEKLIQDGWSIIAIGRDPKKLEQLKNRFPNSVLTFTCDLTKASDVDAFVSDLEKQALISKIQALINNAGIWKRVSFLESDDTFWTEQFATNVLGSVRLTRELLKKSVPAGTPLSIVNISSTLGLRPVAETAAYSATKAAMVSWTKTLALEMAPHRIRVNCICPGIVDTPIHDFHQAASAELKDLHKAMQSAQPLGRIGEPEDIAAGVAYLCSDASKWVTGSVLNIDGGISL